MNIHKIFANIAVGALFLGSVSSCSVMESLSTKLPGHASASASASGVGVAASTESAQQIANEQKLSDKEIKEAEKREAKAKKEAEKKAKKRKKQAKKKKGQTTTPVQTAKQQEQEIISGEIPDVTGGTWHLRSINGHTLSADVDGDDERPYIIFEESTGRFYGNDGCNTVNGDYTALPGDSLRFSNMLSTLRMCPDAKYAQEFNIALDQTATCRIVKDQAESLIELRNKKGTVLMTLARPAMEFLSGSWQVIAIDNHKVDTPDLKLVIDLPERRIHGNTGCNVLNGSIFIDPDKAGSLQFQQIGVTQAFCPDAQWETPMLVALESVESVAPAAQGSNTIDLLDTHGNVVITLRQLPLSDK